MIMSCMSHSQTTSALGLEPVNYFCALINWTCTIFLSGAVCEYPALVCQHGGLQFHEALHCPAYDRTLHSNRYHLGELRVKSI